MLRLIDQAISAVIDLIYPPRPGHDHPVPLWQKAAVLLLLAALVALLAVAR